MMRKGSARVTDVRTWATSIGNSYSEVWKRRIDLIASIPLAILMLLPMIVIAILIRLDSPGNPLFLQKRVGKDGYEFTMWKFRTMVANENTKLEMIRDHDGIYRHKVRNDPRVTPFGRFLRKSSLDELPQLFNVALGHMSLVGPRPELPQIVNSYEPWQHQRHSVRPGITGWWQVSRRSDVPMHELTELDIYYVEHLSPKLDLEIMVKTVVGVVRGVGAY